MRKTRFYTIYCRIQQRCKNKNRTNYRFYGGKGIKSLWKSFEEFRDDMYESYQTHIVEFGEKNTTIERIDNDGNYCKKNCRWATWEEQRVNKTNNRFITFQGKTHCLAEWARIKKIKEGTISRRIDVLGWTIKKALTFSSDIYHNGIHR